MEAIGFLVVVGIVMWIAITNTNGKNKRLANAKAAYHASLAALKKDPTNPDLKQQTLSLGRAYSELTRDQKRVTIFDEVALSNDINAACAAATERSAQTPGLTPEARIGRLNELRAKGLVTEEEYQLQRTRILQEL